MNIVDQLNAKIDRDQASDAEVARIVGMTAEEYDADVTRLDHADDEASITLNTPVRGSVFNRFCTGFGITADRQLFHKFCKRRYAREFWTWNILAELWQDFYGWAREAMIAAEDAADQCDTLAEALR